MRSIIIRSILIFLLIISYIYFCSHYSKCFDVSVKGYNKDRLKISNSNIINDNQEVKTSEQNSDYLGSVAIPKIDVYRDLFKIDSRENTVDKNVQVIKGSDMPDLENGNFILASHNGNSSVSFFRNLHKLQINDEVIVSYNGINYRYFISDIYEVPKTGQVAIKRDKNKKTITMITCKDEDKQLIFIGYIK